MIWTTTSKGGHIIKFYKINKLLIASFQTFFSDSGDLHIFSAPLESGVSGWRKDEEMKSWLTTHAGSGMFKELFFRTYALCANSSLIRRESASVCRTIQNNPHFILSPLKMEILSESPEIIIFHDVVKGELINKIWDAAVVPLEEDAQQPESKSLIGDLCCKLS